MQYCDWWDKTRNWFLKVDDVQRLSWLVSCTCEGLFPPPEKAVCCFFFLYSMKNDLHRARSSVTAAGSLHLILSAFVCYFIVPTLSAQATQHSLLHFSFLTSTEINVALFQEIIAQNHIVSKTLLFRPASLYLAVNLMSVLILSGLQSMTVILLSLVYLPKFCFCLEMKIDGVSFKLLLSL